MTNPLLTEWTTKYGAVPFDQIKQEHYIPAIEKGLEIARKNIKALKENADKPTFENTIQAMNEASEIMDRASNIYFNMLSAESDNDFKALADVISPLLSEFKSEVSMDEVVFARVKALYDEHCPTYEAGKSNTAPPAKAEEGRGGASLTPEQKRLLDITYKGFVRNGALLNPEQKKELTDIDKQLSILNPQFAKNTLNATNAFFYHTTDKDEVAGIPENDLKAAEERAKQKSFTTGWLFNLQAPSMLPVLSYAKNRELRKKISIASGQKCIDGEFSNLDNILKIVKLKHRRANILGYKTHAQYILEERMAENPETVHQFLNRIGAIALPKAKVEVAELKQFAQKLDGIDDLMGWDSSYYSEKLKKEKFGFDEEELKPYFKVENCVQGLFKTAEKLYGLNFIKTTEIPVYHKDVEVYEVFENSKFIGLFYIDLFPRETKRGGAWMTEFKVQGLYKGKIERPHVSIVGNLTPSTADTPSLLNLNEVETLFHEFGHALHGLLSDCTYTELASPNVYWDFVELPSQIMENWVLESDTLALFAFHYKTGEVMPKELIDKVKAAQNFNKAAQNVRQLTFGTLDMAWHDVDPTNIDDVVKYEEEVKEPFRLYPKSTEKLAFSPSFGHIFSGGYSAGYYSYKWAEVLDADAFSKFSEDGIFNKDTARSFRENILAKGNTEHPMELYIRFRGRKPDPDAMLRRDGLL